MNNSKDTYEVWINPNLDTRKHWQVEKPIDDIEAAKNLLDHVDGNVAATGDTLVLIKRYANPVKGIDLLIEYIKGK